MRAFLPRVTERRDRGADRRQFYTESQNVGQPYDYLTSHADVHVEYTRLSQDKTIRLTVSALQPCGHCAFRSILAAALR